MRTEKTEFYLRKDYSFIDMGLNAVIDHVTRETYEVLRRYVWRSSEQGSRELRSLYRGGSLVAMLSQAQIGALIGMSARRVNEAVAVLKRAGWVRVLKSSDPSQTVAMYQLGQVITDEHGGTHEVFWADSSLQGLRDAMMSKARLTGGEHATINSEFSIPERIQFVKKYLESTGICTRGAEFKDPPEPAVVAPPQPLSVPMSAPVPSGGVLGFAQEVEKDEVENEEVAKEKDPLSGGRGSSDPFGYSVHSTPTHETSIVEEVKALPGSAPAPGAPRVPPVVPVVPRAQSVAVVASVSAEDAATAYRAQVEAQRAAAMGQAAVAESRRSNLRGRPMAPGKAKPVHELAGTWKALYAQHYPTLRLAEWQGKEFKQVQTLVERYGAELVGLTFRYVVSNWAQLQTRFKTASPAPTLGFLQALHEPLFAEAQLYAGAQRALEQHKAEAGDGWQPVSAETTKAYSDALKVLKQLGLS